MSELERRTPFEDFADSFVEVERVTHFVDPDSELGRAMARARDAWGEAGPPDPEDFDWSGVRGEPVAE